MIGGHLPVSSRTAVVKLEVQMIVETFLVMETKTPVRGKSFRCNPNFHDHVGVRRSPHFGIIQQWSV
jgi:hypothetical protein